MKPLCEAWDRFWFAPADVAPLAMIRVCTGVVLLYVYGAGVGDVQSYLGPHAWVDATTIDQLRHADAATMPPWWGQSVWFYATSRTAVATVYAAFLGAIVCFTLGLFTRVANVAVWVGHLSFIHRAYVSWCGMDTVLAMLTFYLMFAPSGAAFSLDRRRARAAVPQTSWAANVALRLIQVHMCVIYLCAGLAKLQGNRWWDGTAVWLTMAMHEFAPFDVTWLGHLGDTFCLLLSNVGVLLTLGFEIGFAFLVWNPKARPALLGLAVLLHAGIGFFMGMGAFGGAMLAGCLSFVDASAIRRVVARVAPMPAPATQKAKRAA
ncbi:MAG: HTTM domain-containing protein [Gemmataceae bacterium]